jgi:hypothetical protein
MGTITSPHKDADFSKKADSVINGRIKNNWSSKRKQAFRYLAAGLVKDQAPRFAPGHRSLSEPEGWNFNFFLAMLEHLLPNVHLAVDPGQLRPWAGLLRGQGGLPAAKPGPLPGESPS